MTSSLYKKIWIGIFLLLICSEILLVKNDNKLKTIIGLKSRYNLDNASLNVMKLIFDNKFITCIAFLEVLC